jgi:hypothetical protein
MSCRTHRSQALVRVVLAAPSVNADQTAAPSLQLTNWGPGMTDVTTNSNSDTEKEVFYAA